MGDGGFIVAGGHRLEVARVRAPTRPDSGASPAGAPTLVLLHEGLGSVSHWRDFPQRLADRTGLGVLVYSRWGYGRSDPVSLPRPLTYMHDEARVLPQVMDAEGIARAILVGHSDGASIAILHAGSEGAPARVRALALIAPHVLVEDVSVASIAEAREAFADASPGGLRERLAKHHDDVDGAFRGWNDAWLDPAFRSWNIEASLPRIDVPVLVLQGTGDPYGTMAQVEAIARGVAGPFERVVLEGVGHRPQKDAPEATLDAIAGFVLRYSGVAAQRKPTP